MLIFPAACGSCHAVSEMTVTNGVSYVTPRQSNVQQFATNLEKHTVKAILSGYHALGFEPAAVKIGEFVQRKGLTRLCENGTLILSN